MTIRNNDLKTQLIIACDRCQHTEPVDKKDFVRSRSSSNTLAWDKLQTRGWCVFFRNGVYWHQCATHPNETAEKMRPQRSAE